MNHEAHPSPDTARARLRDAATAALAHGGWKLRFAPPLEARYQKDWTIPRCAEIRRSAMIGVGINVTLVPVINTVMIKQPVLVMMTLQMLLPAALALFVTLIFIRPDVPPARREKALMIATSFFCVATILATLNSSTAALLAYLFIVTLPVFIALFLYRLPFRSGVVLVSLSFLALELVTYLRSDLAMPFRLYPLCFLLTASFPLLLAVRRLERATRFDYLYRVLQEVQIEELIEENEKLTTLAVTDSVTGAANRRRLDAILTAMCDGPLEGNFLLLADIDYFKKFNDTYGHAAGDTCLREVVEVIHRELSPGHLLARFGGEEFAIVLAQVTTSDAQQIAGRILTAVSDLRIHCPTGDAGITISIGIAEREPGDDPRRLLMRADAALYTAKTTGRNCVRWPPYAEMLTRQ